MAAMKVRRGISGEQVESIGAVLHAIARGLLSCRRSVADYGRRRAGDLSITTPPSDAAAGGGPDVVSRGGAEGGARVPRRERQGDR